MAARKHREIDDVQQMKTMIPLITCEITFCQHVSELLFGISLFDLVFWVQINATKQPTNPTQLCGFRTRV